MKMTSKTGWTLALIGMLLLAACGRLDMLVLLIPLAAVLAYSVSWAGARHMNVTRGLK